MIVFASVHGELSRSSLAKSVRENERVCGSSMFTCPNSAWWGIDEVRMHVGSGPICPGFKFQILPKKKTFVSVDASAKVA
jgi:hypothetical protein